MYVWCGVYVVLRAYINVIHSYLLCNELYRYCYDAVFQQEVAATGSTTITTPATPLYVKVSGKIHTDYPITTEYSKGIVIAVGYYY